MLLHNGVYNPMKRLNRTGMTLIEVVVAIAIFGIVMVTIFPAVMVLNRMNNFAYERINTAFIAQEIMEEVISQSRGRTLTDVRSFIISRNYTLNVNNSPTRLEFSRRESNYTVTVSLTRVGITSLFNVMVLVVSDTAEIEGRRAQLETRVSIRVD